MVSHDHGMEAREKEFPWDYAAVSCVLLKDRSCPGIGLPPSDGDESNPETWAYRLTASKTRRTCLSLSRKCSRGPRGVNSNFDPACSGRSLYSAPFSNKRCERTHLSRRIAISALTSAISKYLLYTLYIRLYRGRWLHSDRYRGNRGTILRSPLSRAIPPRRWAARWFMGIHHKLRLSRSIIGT